MMEDQMAPLNLARQRRDVEIKERVREALTEVGCRGMIPSFYNVADLAQVARSTLYRKPELKSLIQEARSVALRSETPYAAKLERLEQENRKLREEIARLRYEAIIQKPSDFQGSSDGSHYVYAVCTLASAA